MLRMTRGVSQDRFFLIASITRNNRPATARALDGWRGAGGHQLSDAIGFLLQGIAWLADGSLRLKPTAPNQRLEMRVAETVVKVSCLRRVEDSSRARSPGVAGRRRFLRDRAFHVGAGSVALGARQI